MENGFLLLGHHEERQGNFKQDLIDVGFELVSGEFEVHADAEELERESQSLSAHELGLGVEDGIDVALVEFGQVVGFEVLCEYFILGPLQGIGASFFGSTSDSISNLKS
jgi:hypothetical protein